MTRSEQADEAYLRIGLQQIATREAVVGVPLGDVLLRAHRARRHRRLLRTAVGGIATVALLAIGGSLLSLHWAGNPVVNTRPQAASTASSSTTARTPLAPRTFDREHWQSGPVRPVVGEPYPFDLPVHCGLRYANFAGLSWETDPSTPVPDPVPDPKTGVTQGQVALAGYMTQIDRSTIRFDYPRLAQPVIFTLMDHPAPGCA